MEGRIVAIRVTDADFAALEAIKKERGIGWNQLLLQPVEQVYGVSLTSAHAKEKPAKGKVETRTARANKGKRRPAKAKAAEAEPEGAALQAEAETG